MHSAASQEIETQCAVRQHGKRLEIIAHAPANGHTAKHVGVMLDYFAAHWLQWLNYKEL
jgi:hypothetical protein